MHLAPHPSRYPLRWADRPICAGNPAAGCGSMGRCTR